MISCQAAAHQPVSAARDDKAADGAQEGDRLLMHPHNLGLGLVGTFATQGLDLVTPAAAATAPAPADRRIIALATPAAPGAHSGAHMQLLMLHDPSTAAAAHTRTLTAAHLDGAAVRGARADGRRGTLLVPHHNVAVGRRRHGLLVLKAQCASPLSVCLRECSCRMHKATQPPFPPRPKVMNAIKNASPQYGNESSVGAPGPCPAQTRSRGNPPPPA